MTDPTDLQFVEPTIADEPFDVIDGDDVAAITPTDDAPEQDDEPDDAGPGDDEDEEPDMQDEEVDL